MLSGRVGAMRAGSTSVQRDAGAMALRCCGAALADAPRLIDTIRGPREKHPALLRYKRRNGRKRGNGCCSLRLGGEDRRVHH
jgi:hypothetical protein